MALTIPDDLVEQAKAAGIADPVEYLRVHIGLDGREQSLQLLALNLSQTLAKQFAIRIAEIARTRTVRSGYSSQVEQSCRRLEELAEELSFTISQIAADNLTAEVATDAAERVNTVRPVANGTTKLTPSPDKPRRSFYDAAQACGYIGGAAYEPDLASNPDHLQGFGQ